MALSREVRRLERKWDQGAGWPKHLESLEITNLRGWAKQRFEIRFPIMAVVGENGAGKSTILQCAASVYRPDKGADRERYASDFFPDTTWEKVSNAEIGWTVREGGTTTSGSVRKPTSRWRGNRDRRRRDVSYIDLSRVQPVSARVGFVRLANPNLAESDTDPFEQLQLKRMSQILGRSYDLAKMSTLVGEHRTVPVLGYQGHTYSGFHQGAGETTIAELLQSDLPRNGLVLIDEIESSLHPRAQRNLIRDLADRCRVLELQIILTTHSPYVLEELPLAARAYIVQSPSGGRDIVYGVSPEFAMSKMDDTPHPEVELYVEDDRAQRMLTEIVASVAPEIVFRVRVIPYGAASVGQSLGHMVSEGRFPRSSSVYLDGDQAPAVGCTLLPGDDAPERVVFDALAATAWHGVAARLGRPHTDVADACIMAMAAGDHHQWVRSAAVKLALDSGTLWQALTAQWASSCLDAQDAERIVQPIRDLLDGIADERTAELAPGSNPPAATQDAIAVSPVPNGSSTAPEPPLELFPNVPPE